MDELGRVESGVERLAGARTKAIHVETRLDSRRAIRRATSQACSVEPDPPFAIARQEKFVRPQRSACPPLWLRPLHSRHLQSRCIELAKNAILQRRLERCPERA